MRLLLDTHAFIWADSLPEKLSPAAKMACEDPANELILSVASVWEMQLKITLGKLALRKPLRSMIADWTEQNAVVILPVRLEHIFHLETLSARHKDPFDRLLIAQALAESLTIVSHDRAFPQYNIPVIW
ncbi:MAG: type II toxin-antitoxin system VapC family toxin [Verrucomicrobiota bacterium]|jgi:PIN domain nuclease of toxin-antitoxin system